MTLECQTYTYSDMDLNVINYIFFLADFSGNKGVVHFIHSTLDLDWLVHHAVAGPYMAVLPPDMFVRYTDFFLIQ